MRVVATGRRSVSLGHQCLSLVRGRTWSATVVDVRTESGARRHSLLGQTVLIVGGSSGIGLATARRAKEEGARLIITGRDAGRLEGAGDEIGVDATAVFDAQDPEQLEAFLAGLPTPVDHVMLSAGAPLCTPVVEIDQAQARGALQQLLLPLCVATFSAKEMGAGGSLVFISGTGALQPDIRRVVPEIRTAALPALIANLALETAPVRVNLIAPGCVDADDVAALAIHLMTNTALTGVTYDVDGGRQLMSG